MKKIGNTIVMISMILVALSIIGCASNPEVEDKHEIIQGEAPTIDKKIERIIVDYKGAVLGAPIPDWVYDAQEDDYESLEALPQLNNKVVIVATSKGKNLDMLESWANNFTVQAEVARRISNYVETKFGGAQMGDKNSEENESFIKEIVTTISKTEINGLGKELDYWVLQRIIDKENDEITEQYYYFVVYGIDKNNLQEQIDNALNNVKADSPDKIQLKSEVEEAMMNIDFN